MESPTQTRIIGRNKDHMVVRLIFADTIFATERVVARLEQDNEVMYIETDIVPNFPFMETN